MARVSPGRAAPEPPSSSQQDSPPETARACGSERRISGSTDLVRISRLAAMLAAIVLIAAALVAPPAAAQALYGAIVGTVTDQSGAPVPGATVTATNTGTSHKVDAQTDSDG